MLKTTETAKGNEMTNQYPTIKCHKCHQVKEDIVVHRMVCKG